MTGGSIVPILLLHRFLRLNLQPGVAGNWKYIANPQHLDSNPVVGGFFEVDQLDHTHLTCENKKRLFASSEVVRLLEALDQFMGIARPGLTIEGSPGLGKSCTTWAWACTKGLNAGRSVLWVHVAKYMDAACISFSDNACSTCTLEATALREMLMHTTADIVVFDGYGLNMGSQFESCVTASTNRDLNPRKKTIFVSSLAGILKSSQFGWGPRDLQRFEISPWTLEDYRVACSDSAFFISVRPILDPESTADTISEDLLIEKYFYAGASARWMFEMNIVEVKEEINRFLSTVRNVGALVELQASTASAESCNHLLMRTRADDGELTSFLVSKYAMQQAMRKFRKKGFGWAYQLAEDNENRSHFGWVLEFDFVSQLFAAAKTSDQKLVVNDQKNAHVSWKVLGAEKFDGCAATLKH